MGILKIIILFLKCEYLALVLINHDVPLKKERKIYLNFEII